MRQQEQLSYDTLEKLFTKGKNQGGGIDRFLSKLKLEF
jgi:hypothetical protein